MPGTYDNIDFEALKGEDTIDTTLCDQVDENGLYVICNSGDGTSPSDIYGIEVFVGIFFGFIFFSGMIVCFILMVSRGLEQRRDDQRSAAKQQRIEGVTKTLPSKTWADGMESVGHTATVRTASEDEDDLSSGSSVSNNNNNDNPQPVAVDVDELASSRALVDRPPKDGSACAICSQPFKPGEAVYQSNNPRCRHWQHKACMDKWLQYQNSCPTCNLPFVVVQPETV